VMDEETPTDDRMLRYLLLSNLVSLEIAA